MVIDDWAVHLDAAICSTAEVPEKESTTSLQTGEVWAPFDVIPIFVSNKQPSELADEAFLRRIRYKVEIPPPSAGLFHEILRRECERNEVAYDEAAAQYLVDEHFTKLHRKMRGCHPRDIVESIAAAAAYRGTPRVLSQTTIDEACANYFV